MKAAAPDPGTPFRIEDLHARPVIDRDDLLDELTPDAVRILVDGRIVETGLPDLAQRLETEGYNAWR